MSLAAPLAITWVAATLLVLVDGRRPWVAWAAVGALALQLVALVALGLELRASTSVEAVTGGWAQGVGIRLRADALGILFAILSSAVVTAALVHEALRGVRSRAFPALVLLSLIHI